MKSKRAANALLLDAEDNLLVLWRSETHPHAAFEPDLPGGAVEENEEPDEGMAREILEETGLVVAIHELREAATLMHPDFTGTSLIRHSLFGHRVAGVRPEITISWEHHRYEWVPLSEIKGLDAPIQRQFEAIIKDGFFDRI